MGNSDSHSGMVPPVKSSTSQRFSCSKEEAPSARSWWRTSQGGDGGGRSRGRSYWSSTSTSTSSRPPYSSWNYEWAPKASGPGPGPPAGFITGGCSFLEDSSEKHLVAGGGGGSPKVLLSKDGSMRVEFTNSRGVTMETQEVTTITPCVEPSLRTSKGSSLSSDGSWYDSPWGSGVGEGSEMNNNVFVSSSGYNTYSSTRTQEEDSAPRGNSGYSSFFSDGFSSSFVFTATNANMSTGYTSCSSARTEDSGLGDSLLLSQASSASLNYVSSMLPSFPTALDTSSSLQDVIQEEEVMVKGGGVELPYSSLTLPCRTSSTSGNSRKDFLKSRIRRLSDWTGSLSRKKRRIQEPYSTGSGSQVDCSTLWSFNPLHSLNQEQVQFPAPLLHCGSSRDLNQVQEQVQSLEAQSQNVYQNFMQELETGQSSTADRTEGSDIEEEEEEEDEELQQEEQEDQGVVRRAGWLSFKALLSVSRDRKLELASRRKWKHYWVTLKGCTLLFYETHGKNLGAEQDVSPRYALTADDSMVQSVPEHPKKEHVFCLSNSHGDVYLFQATSQTDLENWVTSIHSASAALLARREGTEETLRLLRCRSQSLLQEIDSDAKMKKMAELQLSIIKETKSRKAVESQIQQWEQNLEKLHLDLFRLRCYLSSLQGGELPNPKSLLAIVSRPSKSMLGRLGVFSVSSFHALVCSRDEEVLQRRRLTGGGVRRRRRRRLPSSLRDLQEKQRLDHVSDQETAASPAGHSVTQQVPEEPLDVFTLRISRVDAETDLGFVVTGHVDGTGKSHVFVSEVNVRGLSFREGLRVGDEVLAVNGSLVSGLDLDLLQSLFSYRELQLLLRRHQSQDPEEPMVAVWPVPADTCDPSMTPVPLFEQTPSTESDSLPVLDDHSSKLSEDVELQSLEQVYSLYQTFPEGRAAEADVPRNPYREGGLQTTSPAHLSRCQRLRRVIEELVTTEKSYVKDLVCLFDIYLTPLQQETFLSKDEMEALFGCLPEMLDFQRVFLQTLINSCPDSSSLETPAQLKKLLFSLGGSFLYYADHFKHYSGFCANHSKVQKVLERAKTDAAFKHFLDSRNPTNQHSASLESYLIKPVQRVLKYPLLLRELVYLTEPQSPEHTHLTEALRAMEKVASHINEMQKIYEDYGCVFDQLTAEQSGQVTEISMGEFLIHSSVVWLNPLQSLGRLRKDPELTVFVFKRAVILVYRENKLKKRMTGSRSADLDPFRFRWLIPISEVHVRSANITGSESSCVWELVHSRSEVEGRPETVFQLCSSSVESKASVLRTLRLLLRDRPSSGSLRRTRLSTAEKSISWRRRQQRHRSDTWRSSHRQGEERLLLGDTCSEPLLPSRLSSNLTGKRSRLCSLTGDLEAQLQRLNFSEEEAERGAAGRSSDETRRGSSLRRNTAGDTQDVNSLLERDFSVQSLTSIINEDCFYDNMMGIATVVTSIHE